MGFGTAAVRDKFLSDIDDGALVLIWTRSKRETGWRGCCRGFLQLRRNTVHASAASSAAGEKSRGRTDSEFAFGVEVVRAWEADPSRKVKMEAIAPRIWPNMTRVIGVRSGRMERPEIESALELYVRETTVYGRSPVAPGAFAKAKALFST